MNVLLKQFGFCFCLLLLTSVSYAQFVCGVCGNLPPIRTQIEMSEIIVSGKVLYSLPANPKLKFPGMSVIAIDRFEKGDSKEFVEEQLVTVPYHLDLPKDRAIRLPGTFDQDGKFYWGLRYHRDVSSQTFQFILGTPAKFGSDADRLAYYFEWLEHSDPLIAQDALQVFRDIDVEDIIQHRHLFDVDRLRVLLHRSAEGRDGPGGFGLYALLLGSRGKEQDSSFLKQAIFSKEFQPLYDPVEVLAAYLMMSGEKGLDLIDRDYFKNPEKHLREPWQVLYALDLISNSPENEISRERMKLSIQRLLTHEEHHEESINALIAWEDWTMVDQVADLFHVKNENAPAIRQAVFRYLGTIQSKAEKPTPDQNVMKQYAKAMYYLSAFKKIDPQQFRNMQLRYFSRESIADPP